MDAAQTFMQVLRGIEDSKLNYSMSRTPFSATISLKCSFLKRFVNTSKNSDGIELQADEKAKEVMCENDEIKEEIMSLKKSSEVKEKKLLDELCNLQKLYDAEKIKSKDLELKVANFREEFLNVKKNKNEMTKSLKTAIDKCEASEIKSKCLEEDKDALEKELKVKTEATASLSKDMKRIRKENDELKNDHAKIKTELEDLKNSDLQKNKAVIECDICDVSVKTQAELKKHNNLYHSHSKSSQYVDTESFEHFRCYYCDDAIKSKNYLESHFGTCESTVDTFLEQQVPSRLRPQTDYFPCEFCEAFCKNMYELERHWTAYHYQETVHKEAESDYFQCEICPLGYNTEADLELHKQGIHWGKF